MSQIVEAMSVFLEVVKNHSFYEEQGFPHDANFERFALEGFREAVEELQLEGKHITLIVFEESDDKS